MARTPENWGCGSITYSWRNDKKGRGRLAAPALAQSLSAPQPQLDRSAIRELVDQVAARVGLDCRLAHAIVHTESNCQPLAVSPKGAVGLMQIMPALVRQSGGRFDIRVAMAACSAGESTVARYGGVPPYREPQDYVRRILAALR